MTPHFLIKAWVSLSMARVPTLCDNICHNQHPHRADIDHQTSERPRSATWTPMKLSGRADRDQTQSRPSLREGTCPRSPRNRRRPRPKTIVAFRSAKVRSIHSLSTQPQCLPIATIRSSQVAEIRNAYGQGKSGAVLIVREDVHRRLDDLTAIDQADRSFYEFGEFHPDP